MRNKQTIRMVASILLLFSFGALAEGLARKPVTRKARGQSASRVAVDPANGQVVPATVAADAPGIHASPELADALSTSHKGLAEEPVPGVPGAYRVDLRGRFQSAMVAVVMPDGSVEVNCGNLSAAPGTPTQERPVKGK